MQIQLLQNHGHHPEALDVYRKLCEAPLDLEPPPRGVSAGLTGRLAAGQALKYLMRVPADKDAVALICQSLEMWLLKVRGRFLSTWLASVFFFFVLEKVDQSLPKGGFMPVHDL